jgi:hypothetical protein
MLDTRWKFKKDLNNKWFLIQQEKETLFELLETTDDVLFADEFDGCMIENMQDYTFEMPINNKEHTFYD